MRLLFIVHQFMPEFAAGTEKVTMNLARSARHAGHTVEVLTVSVLDPDAWSRDEETGLLFALVDGVAVYAIDGGPTSTIECFGFGFRTSRLETFRRFFDARPIYDVVHVTHTMRTSEAVAVVRERKLPYIVTLTDFFLACYRVTLIRCSGELCEGPDGGRQCVKSCPVGAEAEAMFDRRAWARALLEGAVSVNACSTYIAGVFQREYPDLPIRVVPHGIDLLRFDYRSRRAPRQQPLVVGFLGTLSEAKGVHVLVEAFLRASLPDARLRIVGPCFEPLFMDRLRALIGDAPAVELVPPVAAADVPETLGGFDILCLPSMWPETYSLVVFEAFAAGVPCLVSDVGFPAQVVRQSKCGEVVPVGSVDRWEAHLRRLHQDPGLLSLWKSNVPLPQRLEEEGFVYDQLYRQAVFVGSNGKGVEPR